MEFTAHELAALLNAEVEGDPDIKINNLAKIEEASPGTLTFLANPKYIPFIYTTKASMVLVSKDFIPEHPVKPILLRVENPYVAFAFLLEKFNQIFLNRKGISPQAFIHPNAHIGQNVYIGEFAYIGEDTEIGDEAKIYPLTYVGDHCKIGEKSTLFAGVKVYSMNIIGKECTLHSGVVIGADGFGFAPQGNDYQKVPQIGNVIIEDHVEIGANTTIDRATLGSTVVHKGVKLDNLIQVAHNVEIGENTVIASQTGISGSTKIGANCMIGGQVGIIGHITIADEVKIAAQSGIGSSITQKGAIVQGSPAFEYKKYQKSYVHFRNLHQLYEKINQLEVRLKELEERRSDA
ncbi:MAG TPA: UDP-3-O-(3-hydroxymyristoyl)glucosamine N-acyltransferase [Bacteroidales bacterium]|nr:UDP-3-O-(3-hydroxymyristoyl)glucosamine N-acyltransferase [Bacteroidales bacterium]